MKLEQEIGTSKWESQVQKATVNIIFTANWLRDLHEHIINEHGLKTQHFNLLRILKGRSPDSITPGEIKNVMLDKGRDVTRLVDKLVKQGLVSRNQCSFNRRSVEICITEKGLALTDQLSESVRSSIGRNLQLSESEAEQLSDLLDKLRG